MLNILSLFDTSKLSPQKITRKYFFKEIWLNSHPQKYGNGQT